MRLPEGIKVDKQGTFGRLRFSSLRREVTSRTDDGTIGEVQKRTYDLKSSAQGMMIQVSLPPSVPVKDFAYNQEVELVDPEIGTVTEATFSGTETSWYLNAADIVAKRNETTFKPDSAASGKPDGPGANAKKGDTVQKGG